MKYPTIKIDGKKIKIDKNAFEWYKDRLTKSITFDNQENDLGLSKKDIELLSWNGAVNVYRTDTKRTEISLKDWEVDLLKKEYKRLFAPPFYQETFKEYLTGFIRRKVNDLMDSNGE